MYWRLRCPAFFLSCCPPSLACHPEREPLVKLSRSQVSYCVRDSHVILSVERRIYAMGNEILRSTLRMTQVEFRMTLHYKVQNDTGGVQDDTTLQSPE